MKHTLILAAFVALFASSCKYQRFGQMTMLSTRNVDPSQPGELLARGNQVTVKTRHANAMNEATDRLSAQHPGGEYIMNAVLYLRKDGKKLRMEGDVWGRAVDGDKANPVQTGSAVLAIGDLVLFKSGATMATGTIVGIRPTTAMVQHMRKSIGGEAKEVISEFPLKELTKTSR